jgi:NADPH-dependent 2,4-dienoyl-CoA reductase/sulfur reductase-like enzyme
VVAGSGPLLFAVAGGLRRRGARIVAVVEQAPRARVLRFGLGLWPRPAKLAQAASLRFSLQGVPCRNSVWPVRAEGGEEVRRVTLTDGNETWVEECDLLACGFGLAPNMELALTLGCRLHEGFVSVDRCQATSVPGVFCAGEPCGIGGADCALVEGRIAGFAAADQTARAEALFARRASWHQFRDALARAFALRPELRSLPAADTLVCRCEDVTFGQLQRFRNWREAKLQSRCGMGACQGRVCGAAAGFLLAWGVESVRPPIFPARVESLVSAPRFEMAKAAKQP